MVMTQIAYFNTSYVVIKHGGIGTMIIKHFNFNTSYVVIKQALYEEVDINKKNFNTSYVVIKQIFLLVFYLR